MQEYVCVPTFWAAVATSWTGLPESLLGMLFGVGLQASELFAYIQRGEVYNCSSFCLHILNEHPQTDT